MNQTLGLMTTLQDTGIQGFPYVACGKATIGHIFPKSFFTQVSEGKAVNLISFNPIHSF